MSDTVCEFRSDHRLIDPGANPDDHGGGGLAVPSPTDFPFFGVGGSLYGSTPVDWKLGIPLQTASQSDE